MRAVEAHAASADGLTAEHIRKVPLRSLEAWANSTYGQYQLEDAPSWEEIQGIGHDFRHLVRTFDPEEEQRKPQLRIRMPATSSAPTKLGNEFYAAVAKAYSWLSIRTRRPAAELAELNAVPITTIHRWVKEARRRGLLPPGRRGGAG